MKTKYFSMEYMFLFSKRIPVIILTIVMLHSEKPYLKGNRIHPIVKL